MDKYYLAVDIGASSGRHILGSVDNGKITLQEIYRFKNNLIKRNGQLCWDIDNLFQEIINGMCRCAKFGKIPSSMGIDTWGVDFVLLDKNNQIIGDTVSYRDSRTNGIDREIEKMISQSALYEKTGIQKQCFNTINQLYSIKLAHPEQIEQAEHFLMVPEYFNFLLTGVQKNEYTNSTTTQLVNARTKTWDSDLIRMLGIKASAFGKIYLPKTSVGYLKKDIQTRVGFNCKVVLPATHDTGSAVMAVPVKADEDCIYLSSGTWSLIGTERVNADCSEKSRKLNFTNEGGYDYRFRHLKNIMGLWIIQKARSEMNPKHSFNEICAMAQKCKTFPSRIDVDDPSFLSPDNMTDAIKDYCRKSGRQVPETAGELFSCIYHSLAQSYQAAVKEIKEIAEKNYSVIRIVGGGGKDDYLNALTAKYTGKTVLAGPVEATAIGNLMAQMLKDHVFSDLVQARSAVADSFEIKKY